MKTLPVDVSAVHEVTDSQSLYCGHFIFQYKLIHN